jgi:hypothetical protein
MPQAIPFIIAGAAVGSAGYSIYSANQQMKASKQAASDLDARSQQAVADLKTEEANASTMAMNAIQARRSRMIAGSSTIFTNPLGIAGMAETSKKTLLGS